MTNIVSKKINTNLKFVYSDNNSLSVIFHDNDLLMGVVGEFNKNLKELEIIQKKLFNIQIEKNKSLETTVVNVLVENRMKDGIKLFGRTEYMTSVIFDGNLDNIGKIVQVEVTSSNQNTLFGKLKESFKQKVA